MLSQFKYDGAGHFTDLMSYRNKVYSYNDDVDRYDFDSVVAFHVKVIDRSQKPEQYGYPVAVFGLTENYLNSTPELKDTFYRMGDFARYYNNRVYGNWMETGDGNEFNGFAIFGVKSEVWEVNFTKLRLQVFASSTWLDVPVRRTVKTNPGEINYLGTLSVDLVATGDHSGRTIKPAYFKYDTAIVEGNTYQVASRMVFDEAGYLEDKKVLGKAYPNLFKKYGGNIRIIR